MLMFMLSEKLRNLTLVSGFKCASHYRPSTRYASPSETELPNGFDLDYTYVIGKWNDYRLLTLIAIYTGY